MYVCMYVCMYKEILLLTSSKVNYVFTFNSIFHFVCFFQDNNSKIIIDATEHKTQG